MKIVLTERQLNKILLKENNPKMMKLVKSMLMSSLSEEFRICKIDTSWHDESGQPIFIIYVPIEIADKRSRREDLVDEAWILVNTWLQMGSVIIVKPC